MITFLSPLVLSYIGLLVTVVIIVPVFYALGNSPTTSSMTFWSSLSGCAVLALTSLTIFLVSIKDVL